jgi:hypothetical protein
MSGREIYIKNELKSEEEKEKLSRYALNGIVLLDIINFRIPIETSYFKLRIVLHNNVALKYLENDVCELKRLLSKYICFRLVDLVYKYANMCEVVESILIRNRVLETRIPRISRSEEIITKTFNRIELMDPYVLDANMECSKIKLNFKSNIFKLIVVFENPDFPYKFISNSFKHCELKVLGFTLFEGDQKHWLIVDKVNRNMSIPDKPIFTYSTLDNNFGNNTYSKLFSTKAIGLMNSTRLDDIYLEIMPSKNLPSNTIVYIMAMSRMCIQFQYNGVCLNNY